jgi:DNA-binding MarR family transcriptional regulator
MKQGLGTQLTHLLELLDGAVLRAYEVAGLDYRPRFTPVMRVLAERESLTVGQVAEKARITQPAATQTVALMKKQGLITVEAGADDARQRVIRLSPKGRKYLPQLQVCWEATGGAAASLDADLNYPLSQCLADAIRAIEQQSFDARIRAARAQLTNGQTGQDSAISPHPQATSET